MVFFWIVVALAFAVAEVVTLALFAAFFALAAVGGAVAAALGGDFLVQALVVFGTSVVGIVLARPLVLRYVLRRRDGTTASGARELVGKAGIVTQRIAGAEDHERGHVRITGESWLAVSEDGSQMQEGTEVRVVDIRRATLVVQAVPVKSRVVEEVQ